MYLDQYKLAEVEVKSGTAYAFLDPNKKSPLTKGNYFSVTNGEPATVIAQSGGYSCVIFDELLRAGWIKSTYLKITGFSDSYDPIAAYEEAMSGKSDAGGGQCPSAADLDAISADIVYPRKKSMYLDQYKLAEVEIRSGNAYAFLDPNKKSPVTKGNYFLVQDGEPATVIAQSGSYSCVIFDELLRAGWIKSAYLNITGFSDSYDPPSVRD